MVLEGRSWMQVCIDKFDAKIIGEPKQELGYWYIYQPYTTCFVEFDSVQKLKDCKVYLDKNCEYWNYDGYGIYKSQPHEDMWNCRVNKEEIFK